MRSSLVVAAALALAACGGAQPAPPLRATLAFTHVRVFDGEKLLPDESTVLVDGDHITAVGPGVTVPPGVEVVDGKGKTLLPGLIDAHVHIFDGSQLTQALAFGVTTVLDMFMPAQAIAALHTPAPDRADLRTAGILATAAGGHGTEYGFKIPTLEKPADAPAWVDARIAEGSDYIKIILDDGSAYGIKWPTLSRETVAAIVVAAHARGKMAVAHIATYEDARAAIDAGVDGIVHIFRDRAAPPDFGAFVKSKKAFVTPTLVVLRGFFGHNGKLAEDPTIAPYLPPDAIGELKDTFKKKPVGPEGAEKSAIPLLRDAGVPILAGTDTGNPGTTAGASLHVELELLVADGLSPAQALAAATSTPARVFGLADRGHIASGQRADLLLVDGDPTADILKTRAIAGIWHAGVRFDREAYRAALPKAPTAVAGVSPGLISNFDDGSESARVGRWIPSTDAIIQGTSTVDLKVVDKALSIKGTVVLGGFAVWAGAMFMPGAAPFDPTDLSAAKGFRFTARGDGKPYAVMIFARSRGRRPSVQAFTPGTKAGPVEMTWQSFNGLDGTDIMGILIGQSTTAGPFELVVDDFELR